MFVQQTALPLTLVSGEKKPLRDYQLTAIEQIMAHYQKGVKSVGLISPTGSGKTLIATALLKQFIDQGERVLFIIHRQPLVGQTVRSLQNHGIAEVGYIKAGYPQANDEHRVIVASIQTLARRDYPPNIGLVVFDESHTTSFYKTAQKLTQFYAESPIIALSKVKFLHLTATPFRLKKKEYFGNHIQALVQTPHIGQLIKRGYLVPARHFGYNGLADFSKLETDQKGDFKKSQLNVVCGDIDYNKSVVEQFLKVCPERKAICFAAGVKQSLLLTELFEKAGLKAEHIQAETPDEERDAIYRRFALGETQIISSVGVLTEGYDEPSVEAVILARPTKSLALLIQMCGRGLRLSYQKKDCFLLDFGENFQRLGRIDTKRKIGLCPRKETQKEALKVCPRCRSHINIFSRICPDCGYVFPRKTKDEDEFIKGVFGELLSADLLADIKYVRSQRKSRFTKGLNPDALWELWEKRRPDQLFCNDWLLGAIFKGDRSPLAQELFREYLLSVCPKAPKKWYEFHLKLEFVPAASNYQFPPNFKHWTQILKVSATASFSDILRAYRDLIAVNQDDDERIKELNSALSKAVNFKEIQLEQEGRKLLSQIPIEYAELMSQIDAQMERIGMDIPQGRAYLQETYGVKSRQQLTDLQLIEFLQDLMVKKTWI